MKILVTGGTGYIGSHTCVELLNNGYEVVIIDNLVNSKKEVVDKIEEITGKKDLESLESLCQKIFPKELRITTAERHSLLLNIEKRRGILKKEFNNFSEFPIAQIRQRILDLFTQVSSLLCAIGCSGLKIEKFPQQEMIILSQLFTHIIRLIEEVQNVFIRTQFPLDDVELSLTGMEDMFADIGSILKDSLAYNREHGFKIVESKEKRNG